MPKPARHAATYADLERVPDHMVGEILNGELVVSPRPGSPHARTTSVLGMRLGGPFDLGESGPGGWWILDEPELHLGDDVLVPDLAGWRRERLPALPNIAAFDLAPDWVCEVISPGTARMDRIVKMAIYGNAGVAHAWLVDPQARTLEIYRRAGEHWIVAGTHADQDRVRAEPFAEIELDMSGWWI